MDTSAIKALLVPLLRPLATSSSQYSNVYYGNNVKHHSMITADTAIGAAATLGISLGLLRLAMYTLRYDQNDINNRNDKISKIDKENIIDNDVDSNKHHMFLSFLQTILLRSLFQRKITDTDSSKEKDEGDSYFSVAYNKKVIQGEQSDDIYQGSCHCNSIAFTLKVKGSLKAFDCTGKIRYPHIYTNSSQFQVSKGSSFLQVYYVTIPEDSDDEGDDHAQDEIHKQEKRNTNTTAAHAFCKRCGVHIFRAPDSKSDNLQVNANCLDSSIKVGSDTKNLINDMEVTFYDSCTKLGAGKGISSQWQTKDEIKDSHAKDYGLLSSSLVRTRSEPMSSTATSQKYFGLMSPSASQTGTESTAMISNSSQSFNMESHRIDPESLSMDSSSHSSSGALYNAGFGINNWAVGSSLRSSGNLTIDHDTPTTTRTKSADGVNTETSINALNLQHQLKYYMKRHLSPRENKER